MGGPFGYDQRHAEEEVVAEWEEALESDHQRQAKVIVMEAIAAAERRGWKRAIEAAADACDTHIPGEQFGDFVRAMPYPEKE
jgi:hypothetical protein